MWYEIVNEDGVLVVMAVVLDIMLIVVVDVVNILVAMVMVWCVCGVVGLALNTMAVTWW